MIDILIAIGIAVLMLMLYCCVRAGALQDRLMEEHRREMEKKKMRQETAQREE